MKKRRLVEVGRASRSTTADPAVVWERWIDHATWPEWVADCREVTVSAPLRCSSRGRRRLASGSVERFVVTTFVPGRVYGESIRLTGARLESRRDIVCQHDGAELTVSVSLRGPLSWVYRRRLTDRFSVALPTELSRLVALAEQAAAVAAPPPRVAPDDVAVEPPVRSAGA